MAIPAPDGTCVIQPRAAAALQAPGLSFLGCATEAPVTSGAPFWSPVTTVISIRVGKREPLYIEDRGLENTLEQI